MKFSLIFIFFVFLNKHHILSYKNSIQSQSHLKSSEKNSLISTGDRIDGIYRIMEKTNEKTCPYMNEEWIAADESNQNTLVILKFYMKHLSENTLASKSDSDYIPTTPEIIESPINLWRRTDDFFLDSIEECQQLKIINYRIPQTVPNLRFDQCLTPDVVRPPGNSKAILDSNNETAVKIEKNLSDFISTPFYNVLSKPKGVNLYDLCIIANCKGVLQIIAKDLIIGLQVLSSDRECYSHGNLQLYSVFWEYSKEILTLSNMKFNKQPLSITQNSAPWASDMVNIALILAQILKKNSNFKFKHNNIRSPLDLFLEINPLVNFKKISKFEKDVDRGAKKDNHNINNGITSRVVALFNNEYRFKSDNQIYYTNVDVQLGVPPNFNPNNENLSKDELNKQLENSIYDFIIRMLGKTFEKDIKYDQFTSPDEAYLHPFLSQKIDVRMLPSDIPDS